MTPAAEHVQSDRLTADGCFRLEWTKRPDPGHTDLHYDFEWVGIHDGRTVAGPFQVCRDAYVWQSGYEYGLGPDWVQPVPSKTP